MTPFRLIATLTLGLIVFAETGVSPSFAEQGPRQIGQVRPQRPSPQRNLRAAAPAPIEEIVEGFYVSRFQQELGLNDDQFARVLPTLRESLRQRNELGQRRARALNALRQGIANGVSEEEINERIRQFDESDLALRQVQDTLLRSIDPNLSAEQRARLRIVQPSLEQRIRNLIERSRAGARPQ
jgi:hypothetical protein